MTDPTSPHLRAILDNLQRGLQENRELIATVSAQVSKLGMEVAQLRDICRSCAGFGGDFDSPQKEFS